MYKYKIPCICYSVNSIPLKNVDIVKTTFISLLPFLFLVNYTVLYSHTVTQHRDSVCDYPYLNRVPVHIKMEKKVFSSTLRIRLYSLYSLTADFRLV